MKTLICLLAKAILWLRYRIRVSGLDDIAARGAKGILFLPNHPALIEPFITFTTLFSRFQPRFLADKDQMERPILRWFAPRFGARKIPDIGKYGEAARGEIDRAVATIIEGLGRGENWILYPAGRIYRGHLEDLGGNSAVETILREAPGVRIVLVRTTGLWGSSFSLASGHYPSVAKVLLRGLRSILASGIFFTPRRSVTVDVAEPADLPRSADRFVINRYLEDFYNKDALHNTYVPYTIWEKGGTRTLPEAAVERPGAAGPIPPSVRERVIARLQKATGAKSISDEVKLGRDLGLDSLARMDLVLWIEDEFGFAAGDPQGLVTVADVLEAACGQTASGGPALLRKVPGRWFAGAPQAPVEGETITSAFLAQARRAPDKPIIADQTAGVLTYRDAIARILVLREMIEQLPGEYVAIMLPASVAADVVYLSVLFAGKTPVMVNWTVGSRNIGHSLDLLGVRAVLTSKALVKRIEPQVGGLEVIRERLLFLEEEAARVSLWRRLAAGLASRVSWRTLEEAAVTGVAAVLFTSGSESLPKAVPLTHANLLANLRDGLSALEFRGDDRIIGIFPPFHSFGLTCNMLLPLAGGVRTVYHPNPTEGTAIARIVEAYRATVIFGTPTFLRGIVRAATDEQLSSLRVAVTGAEKCPEALYEALARRFPNMTVLEGYGTSECSPVVSVNDYRAPKAGTIGKVLSSLEYAIVDAETGARVGANRQGVLLVRGTSVFHGYLNYRGETPFVEFEGKQWYRTGDMVSEDDRGVLTFRGRLKRFVKIGGEMISLPAVEAVLEPHYVTPNDKGPVIAVEATADDIRPELVLFTVKDTERETVNRQIREAGLSALYGISRVVRLQEMPVLGTGKTDYRALKAMLAEGRESEKQ